jgi:alpha-glucosidase (family GH31 glycosyl hydrolase)
VRRRGPDFELFPDGQPPAPKVAIFSTDATVSLRTGGLTAEVDRSPSGFNLDFTRTSGASGKAEVVCSSGFKSMASLGLSPKIYAQAASETSILATNPYADPAPQGIKNFIQSELSLLVDERVYGFGELFGPLVKNGQSISIWQQDGGTSSEQGYKT